MHIILKQRMGAHHHARTPVGNGRLGIQPRFTLQLTRQPRHFNAQRLKPGLERAVVLLGEDLCGRHNRRLTVARQGAQRRHGGHHGFS